MSTDNVPLTHTVFLLPLQRQPVQTNRRIVGIRPAATRYNRATDLVRLLPLWPDELADDSIAGRTKVLRMLERAMRAERQRGVGGHWAYDLSRHANLMWALRAERAALKALEASHKGSAAQSRNTVAKPIADLVQLP
jgi:Family of unknown function (DUF6477)